MRNTAMLCLVVFAACGGGKSTGDTTPDDEVVDDEGEGGEDVDTNENMIPGERMEEITRILDRKRDASGTRCIERAIDNGELKKNARGRLAVNFVITTAGKASEVEVTKNTLSESKMFTDCILDLLAGIEFGELPRSLPWSYEFRFEAF